jgi:hypothetical protein
VVDVAKYFKDAAYSVEEEPNYALTAAELVNFKTEFVVGIKGFEDKPIPANTLVFDKIFSTVDVTGKYVLISIAIMLTPHML